MPVVTQSRTTADRLIRSRHWEWYDWRGNGKPEWFENSPEIVRNWQTGIVSQTTTSYRSHGTADDAQSEYENASGEDLRKSLVGEYRYRYDRGHDFYTQKLSTEWSHPEITLYATVFGRPRRYRGPLGPAIFPGQDPVIDYLPSQSKIEADGRKAISMSTPTTPEAGLAQFIGELREGLPQLVGLESLRHGASAKSLGGEHLNVQFGLKPFINDLKKLAVSIEEAHRKIRQFQRDSDKIVRRKVTLREDRSYHEISKGTATVSLPLKDVSTDVSSWYRSYPGIMTVSDVVTEKVWFSGAYQYHLAEADNFLGKLERYEQQVNNLLGSRITPETVWELTPWSWLFDWFADAGVFMHNISALADDSLVLRYGYIMHQTDRMRSFTTTGVLPANGSNIPGTLSIFKTQVTKRRTRATPYGFGIDIGALSPRRWAILGALGMTKAPTALR
jgi:hypothetical protein